MSSSLQLTCKVAIDPAITLWRFRSLIHSLWTKQSCRFSIVFFVCSSSYIVLQLESDDDGLLHAVFSSSHLDLLRPTVVGQSVVERLSVIIISLGKVWSVDVAIYWSGSRKGAFDFLIADICIWNMCHWTAVPVAEGMFTSLYLSNNWFYLVFPWFTGTPGKFLE